MVQTWHAGQGLTKPSQAPLVPEGLLFLREAAATPKAAIPALLVAAAWRPTREADGTLMALAMPEAATTAVNTLRSCMVAEGSCCCVETCL